MMRGPDRVMIHRSFRRLDLVPDLEVGHAGERRHVVAHDHVCPSLDLLTLAKELDQLLRRSLVRREAPDSPGKCTERQVTTLRTLRRWEGPAIGRHGRRVALRHRPRRGWVPDQRALA